jgi:hypothetical protein
MLVNFVEVVMLGEFHGFPSHVSHLDDRLRYLNSAVASHGNFGWTRIFSVLSVG